MHSDLLCCSETNNAYVAAIEVLVIEWEAYTRHAMFRKVINVACLKEVCCLLIFDVFFMNVGF